MTRERRRVTGPRNFTVKVDEKPVGASENGPPVTDGKERLPILAKHHSGTAGYGQAHAEGALEKSPYASANSAKRELLAAFLNCRLEFEHRGDCQAMT